MELLENIENSSEKIDNKSRDRHNYDDRPVLFFMILSFSFLIFAPLLISALMREDLLGNVAAGVAGVIWVVGSLWFTLYMTADMGYD